MTVSPHVSEISAVEPLLGSGLVTLPRVNLLPPEIEQRRRFRRIQYGLGAGVAAAVLGVVAGAVLAGGAVSAANDDVAAAEAEGNALRTEAAAYSDVTAVYEQAAAAQAMLTEAMGQEVRYSRFLSDLALSVPENVWLTSLTFTQQPVDPALGTTEPGLGTVTVAGRGFSHEDVAMWLDSIAGQSTLTNPYFSSSVEALIGTRPIVEFASTATLTPAALSGRFTAPAGG